MIFKELLEKVGIVKALEDGKVIRFLGQYKISNTYLMTNENGIICVYNQDNVYAAPFELEDTILNEEVEILDSEPVWSVEDRAAYAVWVSSAEYKELNDFTVDVGGAIGFLKMGYKIARKEWGDVYLFLADGNDLANCLFKDGEPKCANTICRKEADGTITMGWSANQEDLFADDYFIVDFAETIEEKKAEQSK